MDMWTKKLDRNNIDEFIDMYASFAYRSAYRILRDTTRAELAVTDSFMDTYHRRAKMEGEDVVYFFSEVLEKHVSDLAEKYPTIDTSLSPNRNLDDYTAKTMHETIIKKIDSNIFRVVEFVSTTPAPKEKKKAPLFEAIQASGLSVMLLLKLIILAIVVFVATYLGAKSIFGVDDFVIFDSQHSSTKIEEKIVPALGYLPVDVKVKQNEDEIPEITTDPSAVPSDSSVTAESTSTPIVIDPNATTMSEPVATRG